MQYFWVVSFTINRPRCRLDLDMGITIQGTLSLNTPLCAHIYKIQWLLNLEKSKLGNIVITYLEQ